MTRRVFLYFCVPVLVLAAGGLGAGCSPGMFGEGKDEAALHPARYRPVHQECSSVTLAGDRLDSPSARALLKCLNAHGALDPVAAFVARLSDGELDSLLGIVNHWVLATPGRARELKRGYDALIERGMLEPALVGVGRLFGNPGFVSALIDVAGRIDRQDPRAWEALGAIADSAFAGPAGQAEALELVISVVESRAFSSLLARFEPDSLRDLTAALKDVSFGSRARSAAEADLTRELLEALGSGRLFAALDASSGLGSGPSGIALQVPRAALILKTLLISDARWLRRLTPAFEALNAPLSCVRGSASVPNASVYFLRELARVSPGKAYEYISSTKRMHLALLGPFCSMPPALTEGYPILSRLLASPAGEALAGLVRAFDAAGLSPLLASALAESSGALPLLKELDRRAVWEDLLLTLALPDERGRQPLRSLSRALLEPRDSLGGESAYGVLASALAGVPRETIERLFLASGPFLKPGASPLLSPLLRAARVALLMLQPHQNPAREALPLLSAAARTLFRAAELGEFAPALSHLSQMAADGRLKEVADVFLALYAKSGGSGAPLASGPVRDFRPMRRHDLSASDLALLGAPAAWADREPSESACSELDLGFDWSRPGSRASRAQFGQILACLGTTATEAGSELTGALAWFQGELLIPVVSALSAVDLGVPDLGRIVSAALQAVDDGRAERVGQAVALGVERPAPLLRPALSLLNPVLSRGRPLLRELEGFGARALRDPGFVSLAGKASASVRALGGLLGGLDGLDAFPQSAPPSSYRAEVLEAVRSRECETERAEERTEEILREFEAGVTNGTASEPPRLSMGRDELRPVLESLAGRLNAASVDALIRGGRYFSLRPGEARSQGRLYRPEYLGEWLRSLSSDWSLIEYFPPGESRPRLRFVNALDRLQLLIVYNDQATPGLPRSRFTPEVIESTNYAVKVLMMLGESWGDEPEELWPEPIREKARATRRRPPTLAETYQRISELMAGFERRIGYPPVAGCQADRERGKVKGGLLGRIPLKTVAEFKRRLFNTRQVLSVIAENLPGAAGSRNGRIKVIRDLAYELVQSAALTDRSPLSPNNPIRIIMDLVYSGALRSLGARLWKLPENSPQLNALSLSLVGALKEPALSRLSADIGRQVRNLIALWGIVDADPRTHAELDLFLTRSGAWNARPEVRALRLGELSSDAVGFLLEPESASLRQELARQLESEAIDGILTAISSNPDEFHRLLEFLGRAIQRGEVRDFLESLRRALATSP